MKLELETYCFTSRLCELCSFCLKKKFKLRIGYGDYLKIEN